MERKLCPFDGFKICIYNDDNYVRFLTENASKFNLMQYKIVDSKIIDYPKKGDINGIRIKIHYTKKGLTVTISGSFHKYHNSCKSNFNQFYWEDFINVHEKLTSLLSIPQTAYIVNLEVGINIEIPDDWNLTPTQILKSIFFIQRITKNGTKSIKYPPYNGYSIHHKTEDYEYKIYDKGKQYRLQQGILRYEKKFIKSRPISKLGYIYFGDLLNFEKLKNPIVNIVKGFKKIIIYNEKIEFAPDLTETDKNFLIRIKKIDFFEDFQGTSEEFEILKKHYFSLIKKYNCFDIHAELISILIDKFKTNLNIPM